jgi:hypothetical protein
LELYAGQRQGGDIDALLRPLGFACVASCAPCDHCDRLFRRTADEQHGGKSAQEVDSWAAKVDRSFPCAKELRFTGRLPGDRGSMDVDMGIDLRGHQGWGAFVSASAAVLLDLCQSTHRPSGDEAHGASREAEEAACANELQSTTTQVVVDASS